MKSHGFLLTLGVAIGQGCGTADDDAVPTADQMEAFCQAKCNWAKGCKPASDRPTFDCDVSQCVGATSDARLQLTSAAFISAMTRCYAGSSCETAQQYDDKIPEFYCLAQTADAIITDEGQQQQAACLARREACRGPRGPGFNDDWCQETFIWARTSIRDRLQECWQLQCEAIEDCLDRVVPR